MEKLIMVFLMLTAIIFYGIHSNAGFLKEVFSNNPHANISKNNNNLEKQYFELYVNTEDNEKKVKCVQVDGVLYCDES